MKQLNIRKNERDLFQCVSLGKHGKEVEKIAREGEPDTVQVPQERRAARYLSVPCQLHLMWMAEEPHHSPHLGPS